MLEPERLRAMPTPELVELAMVEHGMIKRVADEIALRDVDVAAADALVIAYHNGRAQPWLAALLFGCIRHPHGYQLTREILLARAGQLSESYAGIALDNIAGMAARDDLLEILRSSAPRRVREGAAYGLAHLNDPIVVPDLLEAVRTDRISDICAGRRLASLPISHDQLAEWLLGTDDLTARVAVRTLLSRSLDAHWICDTILANAIASLLATDRFCDEPWLRRELEKLVAKRSG